MRSLIAKLLTVLLLLGPIAAFSADLIDINTADAATLEKISGIGEKKAQAIIDYRSENGPFATVDDITDVKGIGPATLEKNRDVMTVGEAAPEKTEKTDDK